MVEVFGTGTASLIQPVGELIASDGRRFALPPPAAAAPQQRHSHSAASDSYSAEAAAAAAAGGGDNGSRQALSIYTSADADTAEAGTGATAASGVWLPLSVRLMRRLQDIQYGREAFRDWSVPV